MRGSMALVWAHNPDFVGSIPAPATIFTKFFVMNLLKPSPSIVSVFGELKECEEKQGKHRYMQEMPKDITLKRQIIQKNNQSH